MDDIRLMLISEIYAVVHHAKTLLKDSQSDVTAVGQAIEDVSTFLPKATQPPASNLAKDNVELARNIFADKHYAEFGEYLINHFSVTWLQKGSSVISCFDNVFLFGPDEESFVILFQAVSMKQLSVVRLHCLSLLEMLIQKHCIVRILECYCCGELMVHRPLLLETDLTKLPEWQTLLSAICSLPSVAASSLEAGTSFLPKNYIPFVSCEILTVLRIIYGRLQNGQDSSVVFLAALIGKLSLCGYAELLLKHMLAELEQLSITDYLWRRIVQQLISGVPDRCMESVITQLILIVSSHHVLDMFLRTMPLSSTKLVYILSHKLLLVRCFQHAVAVRVLRNVIGYLSSNSELSKIFVSTFRSLLTVWADGSSLRHRPLEHTVYLSQAVVACITFASPECIATVREDVVRHLLDGLPGYLESSVPAVRQVGSVVAEKLSDAVHKEQESQPLHFNVEKNELVESVLELSVLPNNEEIIKSAEPEPKVAANNRCSQLEDKLSSGSTAREREIDSDDDENDLKPYAVFAEAPLNPKRPVYLAQCIDGLIKPDDPESVEQCLIHVEALIRRASPSAVRELGVELCRVLLHLEDRFAITDFAWLRHRAMVALTVVSPTNVAEYLAGEFYAPNYSIRQRIDVLDVLAAAATELSEPPKAATSSSKPSSTWSDSAVVAVPTNSIEVVRERVEAKTRRFGKGPTRPAPPSAANRFAPVCGSFFYPLLSRFDRRTEAHLDLLGADHLVLERLVYALGAVVLASVGAPAVGRMSAALLEFVRCGRQHAEAGVRRAVLYAACAALASLPPGSVLDDPTTFTELGDWLHAVVQRDADSECQKRAANALQLLNSALGQDMDGLSAS